MNSPSTVSIREALLEAIASRNDPRNLQLPSIAQVVLERLGAGVGNQDLERAILTSFHDLLRTGQLAPGLNTANWNLPWFHVTESGRRTLAVISRDPFNPDGYLAHLAPFEVNPEALSFVQEALKCLNSGCDRAAAVMIGVASESLALELRSHVLTYVKSASKSLRDWRIAQILKGLREVFEAHRDMMPRALADDVTAYWPAFTQQVRGIRNEGGHPSGLDAVSPEAAYAALLVFPEIAKLVWKLNEWIVAGGLSAPSPSPPSA